jgi:hypothetical protein
MAQSGSYNFSVSRDNLITDAHLYIGAIGEGESCSTAQVTEASRMLNMIAKLRAADGMQAWALRRGYILPFSGASSINTDSHVVTSYDTTTLTAASAASDTTLTVASISGFSNADVIGIELDDGSIDWTTVNGAPAGSDITITTGVTSAAGIGNRVYGYTASTDRVQKPLRILEANLLTVSSSAASPIQVVSREEYYMLGNRTSEGPPNQLYYSIEPSSLTALDTNGKIYLYPRFSNGKQVIEFTYHRPFQDFDAAADEPDFPQAFYLPLMLELASMIAPKFGVALEERARIMKEAEAYREQALWTVSPGNSIYLSPREE